MKKIVVLLIITACLLGLTACSSESGDSSGGATRNNQTAGAAPESPNYDYGDSYADESWGLYDNAEANYDGGGGGEAALPNEQERKIIRNADMIIESKNPVELFRSLNDFNSSLGGYEFSRAAQSEEINTWVNGEIITRTYSVVNAVLKVPPNRLDDFMNFAGENGKVLSASTFSDDVTDQYYDMKTRVETKRRSLESYYVLLERAASTSEILTLQRTIDSIIEEIEAFEGRMRLLENLSDMATVTIQIYQEREPDPEPEPEEKREIDWNALTFGDMWYFIRNGFKAIVNFFATILQWLIIAVAVTSPIWLIVGVIVIITVKRSKKKRKSALNPQVINQKPENPTIPENPNIPENSNIPENPINPENPQNDNLNPPK